MQPTTSRYSVTGNLSSLLAGHGPPSVSAPVGSLPMAVTIRSDGPANPTVTITGASCVFHVLNVPE